MGLNVSLVEYQDKGEFGFVEDTVWLEREREQEIKKVKRDQEAEKEQVSQSSNPKLSSKSWHQPASQTPVLSNTDLQA